MRVFVDANIFMYAVGVAHPHKAPSIRVLERLAGDGVGAVSDAEVLQELLYRYWHLNMVERGAALVDYVVQAIPTILPINLQDVVVARSLLVQHPALKPRDAIHAAVMLNHGLTHLYSYDQDFDLIPGLTRLEPGVNR